MPKGAVEGSGVATGSAKLREMIRTLEVGLANVKGQREKAVELLELRDEIEAEMARLKETGLDLRPEETRVETIDNMFMNRAALVNRELRSLGGLASIRREKNPPEDHWWWYLDLYLAERQRKRVVRALISVAVVLVLAIVVTFVLDRLSGLSPEEKKAKELAGQADQLVLNGEYEEALEKYLQAIQLDPSQREVQVMIGILYEKKGEKEKAQQAFTRARSLYASEENYYLALARGYESAGEYEKALEKVEKALALAPQSAQGYFIRASIYELMHKYPQALDDFERSAQLAQEQGDDTLYVLAKMRFGMLLQRVPSLVTPTPTPQ